MSNLKAHMSQGLPVDQAVKNFASEMIQKYPMVNATSPLQTVVEFKWRIVYYTQQQMFYNVVMHLVGSLVGIRLSRSSTLVFNTYHILDRSQVTVLRFKAFLKKSIYPLLVLLMLLAGFVMVAWSIVLISAIRTTPPVSSQTLWNHAEVCGFGTLF